MLIIFFLQKQTNNIIIQKISLVNFTKTQHFHIFHICCNEQKVFKIFLRKLLFLKIQKSLTARSYAFGCTEEKSIFDRR